MRSHRTLWWQSGTIKALASSLGKTCGEQTHGRGFNRAQLHLIFTLKPRWSKPAKALWVCAWSRIQTVFFCFLVYFSVSVRRCCWRLASPNQENGRADLWKGSAEEQHADRIQARAERVLANRIAFPAGLFATCTDVKKDSCSTSNAEPLAPTGWDWRIERKDRRAPGIHVEVLHILAHSQVQPKEMC